MNVSASRRAGQDCLPARTAVGLGSNLGHRARNLLAGRRALEELLSDLRTSRVYETAPVGGTAGRPRYLNACCVGRGVRGPSELLEAFREAERRAGRGPEARDGPRTLDLDLLLYGDRRISSPELEVPHPRMAARAFVLVPLAELIPGVEVPGTDRTVAELAERVGSGGVEPVGALEDLVEGEDG